MPKRAITYESWQMEQLADPARAASYLNATLQEAPELFLSALEKVSRASRGVAKRKALPEGDGLANGNPDQAKLTLDSLNQLLHSLGLQLSIAPMEDHFSDLDHHTTNTEAATHL